MRPITTLLAASVALGAVILAAGCGGSADAGTPTAESAGGATTRAAASVPTGEPWTCPDPVMIDDLHPDATLDITYINKSSKSFVLRARQPGQCAPWGSNNNPGQVNATGVVAPGESQRVKLSYDAFTTDRTGTTRVTPLPITINALGDNAAASAVTDPGIALLRVVGGDGKYRARNFFIKQGGSDSCKGTVPISTLALTGTFDCVADFARLDSKDPAHLVITDTAVPVAALWTCTGRVAVDWARPEDTIDINYVNKSSKPFVLRARQPQDCAPWGANGNPGQVNATGWVRPGESRLVRLSYDGRQDRKGKRVSTPVHITISMLGAEPRDFLWSTPRLRLWREKDAGGWPLERRLLLTRKDGPRCEVPRVGLSRGVTAVTAAFNCGGSLVQPDSGPPAQFVISDPKR